MEVVEPHKHARCLGQNFLNSKFHLNKIRAAILREIPVGLEVLQIGPGLGALTEVLQDDYALTLVQYDSRLIELLGYFNIKKVIHSDFSRVEVTHQYFVGNLPYDRAVELMLHAITSPNFKKGFFLIQKEVAEKILSKKSNRLSALFNAETSVKHVLDIPGCCFKPVVRVTGSVLFVRRLYEYNCSIQSVINNREVFSSPRRKLSNVIKNSGIHADSRLGQLSFSQVFELIRNNQR
jgi:16S rRNA (adenine1518-N6/adenine1519-N6)-dimethyltransferase